MGVSDEFSQRRPYNAVSDFVDAHVASGRAEKIAFIDPDRSLTYGELHARSIRFAHALRLPSAGGFSSIGELPRSMESEQQDAGRGASSPSVLQIADGIFLQRGLGLLPSFLATLQREFGAAPQATDFEGDRQGALAAINGWVDEHTRGRSPMAIGELPRRCLEAFVLHVLKGLTFDEVGREMGISDRMAKKHVARALEYLQTCLDAANETRSAR